MINQYKNKYCTDITTERKIYQISVLKRLFRNLYEISKICFSATGRSYDQLSALRLLSQIPICKVYHGSIFLLYFQEYRTNIDYDSGSKEEFGRQYGGGQQQPYRAESSSSDESYRGRGPAHVMDNYGYQEAPNYNPYGRR